MSVQKTAIKEAFEQGGIRPSMGTVGSDGAGAVYVTVGRKDLSSPAATAVAGIDSPARIAA